MKQYPNYKDSGIEWLGEIPEHWRVTSIKFFLKYKSGAIKTGPFGSQLLNSEMNFREVKVYNQENVIKHDLDLGDSYISHDKYKELHMFTVFPGDILLTTRGTICRCLIVPGNAETGILHPCLMRIQPNPKKLFDKY